MALFHSINNDKNIYNESKGAFRDEHLVKPMLNLETTLRIDPGDRLYEG